MKIKPIIVIILSGAVLLTALFLFRNQIFKVVENVSGLSKPEEFTNNILEQIEKTIFTPPPLKYEVDAPQPFLTRAGVIKWTNEQRQKNGLPPLKENTRLDASAKLKVDDMFLRQYFEHTSPLGITVGDLAQKVGYEYIMIGENLALGNFKDSEELVNAWMNSPGHRENILNNRYTEIGVAVFEGIYEGKKTWMAIQHFALPMSYCNKPNENLKSEIDAGESQLDQSKTSLDTLLNDLNSSKPKTREEVDVYNNKINEYNLNLNQYNLLVEEIKNLINNYNNQVKLFNNCLSGTN